MEKYDFQKLWTKPGFLSDKEFKDLFANKILDVVDIEGKKYQNVTINLLGIGGSYDDENYSYVDCTLSNGVTLALHRIQEIYVIKNIGDK